MKRSILMIVSAVLTLVLVPLPAQAQLGVAAGLNFTSLSDVDSGSSSATYDNATGYHVGLFYDASAGPAGIRLGIFYRDAGEVDASFNGLHQNFSLTMIDIPLDLRLNLAATPVATPYIIGGPVFSFPSADDDDIDENMKNVNVAGNIGAGIEINLGGLRLFPELRYAIGISRFMKEEIQVGGISFESDEMQRTNAVMLRLGVGF